MLAANKNNFLSSGQNTYTHNTLDTIQVGVIEDMYHSAQTLGITKPWDYIHLHPDLKSLWNGISNHYSRIKLSHSKQVIWAFDIISNNKIYNFEKELDVLMANLIAQKLDIPQWSTMTLSTRYRHIDEFDIKDVEYDCNTEEGTIIVNWGSIIDGKMTLILSGETEYQEVLANELKARLQ